MMSPSVYQYGMTRTVTSYNVAEAKRRFRELITRVGDGERIVIARRGTPVMAVIPPDELSSAGSPRPVGLAAVAGALSDYQDIDDMVGELHAARERAVDRPGPPPD